MVYTNEYYNNLLDDDKKPEQKPEKDNSQSGLGRKVNEMYSQVKDFTIDKKDDFVDLLKYTKAEITIGAVLAGVVGGTILFNNESARNHCLKMSFSETSAIERQARRIGITVPHMTDFLAKTNDEYMKVVESHNESWSWATNLFLKSNVEPFRRELDIHLDPAFKQHHYEFPQLVKLVPAFADSVLKDLSYLRTLQKKTLTAVNTLDKTWDDYHHDEYHTEIYYTEDCTTDSKGNTTCTTTMHTRQVYDWTDNSYTYYPAFGQKSSELLAGIKKEFPQIKADGMFMPTLETGAENEYAMDHSRKYELKDHKRLTQEQYLAFANNWLTGSVQFLGMKKAEDSRKTLMIYGDKWNIQKNTAKSYSERTYNYSHAESAEFQTSENAISEGKELSNTIEHILGTVESAKTRIPKLHNMIVQYVNMPYNKKGTREDKKLRDAIMAETMNGYGELFPYGVPLKQARWWVVVLGTLACAAGGALAGAGVDFLGERTNLYGKKRREDQDNWTWRNSKYYDRS